MNELKDDKKKTMSIAHSPAIIEYSEKHSKDPLNDSFKKSLSKLIFFAANVLILFLIGQKLSILCPKLKDSHTVVNAIVYYTMEYLMLFSIQNLIYYSLSLFSAHYKLNYPDVIFVPSLFKNFNRSISTIITWSISAYTIPFETFLNLVKQYSEKNPVTFNFFDFETNISVPLIIPTSIQVNDLTTAICKLKIFHRFVPFILKIYIVFVMRDFTIFILNYLIHYKYYEKRIFENTEKITLLRAINDTVKISYNVDIEESSKIVFSTISSDGVQSIKLSDLNRFFDESTAKKIFVFCNGNDHDEISQDQIYMFYVSTLTEQILLEKSICSNSATVQSFKSVLDVVVFMLCTVLFINIFPSVDKIQVDSLKNPMLFMSFLLSMNYSFADSYKSFFNSLNFIFFIRPFEIGDYILLSDKNFEVAEINLLSTILYDGCNFHVFPNSSLASSSIKNMRLNRIRKETFKFKFSYSDFLNKRDELLKKLTEDLKRKATEFKKPYYEKLTILGENSIEVVLAVQIYTSAASFEKIQERQNSLVFKIQNLLQDTILQD